MTNSEALPEKKRYLPTSPGASLLHDKLATDRADGMRHGGNKDDSENEMMAEEKSIKRQRISDEESTNEEASEAGSGEEGDESVKSDDNVIARDEQPPLSHDPPTETKTMTDKVPITPDKSISQTIVNSPSKHPKQLGVGFCMETTKQNSAVPSKSGRVGTRSATSSRPRKIWSKSNRTVKNEEKIKLTKEPRPKRPPTKTGDDEECWYYFCPACQHPFAFPKDEDLPPLDEHFNVSDHVPWGDLRFHQRIQTVRRHMRNKHPDVPESTWPAGYAKVSRSLDDDDEEFLEIDSDSSESSPTTALRKDTADKDYKYPCFIKGCGHVFHTNGWEPPLNDQGEISDDKRWDSYTLIDSVRRHMRLEHPDIDEQEWPCGFGSDVSEEPGLAVGAADGEELVDAADAAVKAPLYTNTTPTSGDCFNYHCPVPGCDQVFGIPKLLYPPLDWYGNVTDYYPWPSHLDYVRQWVHFHIRKDHADYLASYLTSPSDVNEANADGKVGGDALLEDEVNDNVNDVSNVSYWAEQNRCWCSYQQCRHRS